MIGVALGWMYANAGEWVVHRYLLHGVGRNKRSFWSFHWHEHHRQTRTHDHIDVHYHRNLFGWHSQSKETLGLALAAAAHLPLTPVAPFFVATVWVCAWRYYKIHKRAHTEPEWARKHLPWHYDHHMGPDQDANWCVTHPWFDKLMGTYKPYAGTQREARDLARRARHRARRQARQARERTQTPPQTRRTPRVRPRHKARTTKPPVNHHRGSSSNQ